MPANPKSFISGTAVFITFRTREGLPFVPLKFMNMLTESALARAQANHPVELIMYEFEANHGHMIIKVTDPELIPAFVGFFKSDSAKYLNKLLGRRQYSVWVERYDSPTILDHDKARQIFAYSILNPVKDGLVHDMAAYPGVSSYKSFLKNRVSISVKNIPRNKVPRLLDPHHPVIEAKELEELFSSGDFPSLTIRVNPAALRTCFKETLKLEEKSYLSSLREFVGIEQTRYQNLREGKPPLGAASLLQASILTPHTPPCGGRRMICLSTDKDLRKSFINWFKNLAAECRGVYERWKEGFTSLSYPPGMFAPNLPRTANLRPAAVW